MHSLQNLFTSEDIFNIHKILGCISLFNFMYRFIYLIMYKSMFLETRNSFFLMIIHGLLSWSSLMFNIIHTRPKTIPFIYPELRFHSIIFAMRSILCYLCFYYHFSVHINMIICYLTMIAADVITHYYQDGTTIRNGGYGGIRNQDVVRLKSMYSNSQIGATLFMIQNINMAFAPLLAIQIAAFGMTLVKKNLISTKSYHAIYSLSLWFNLFCLVTLSPSHLLQLLILQNLAKHLRFKLEMNKYGVWSVIFFLFLLFPSMDILNYFSKKWIYLLIITELIKRFQRFSFLF